jgi:cytochrome c biogenesis protein CcmG/thiol:disulfide interchange protein DsbE
MKKVALALALLLLGGCGNQTSALPGNGVVDDCSSIQTVATTNKSALVSCLDGNSTFDLGQIKGPALVNVWGSWCWPCQQEMPLFVEFYGKYKEKVGLIGVNVEEADIEDARTFVKSYGMTWPNLHDSDGATRQYLGMGVPITLFVNDQGAITYRKIGVVTSINELERLTQKYLGVKL